jgi:hypothetical protein
MPDIANRKSKQANGWCKSNEFWFLYFLAIAQKRLDFVFISFWLINSIADWFIMLSIILFICFYFNINSG